MCVPSWVSHQSAQQQLSLHNLCGRILGTSCAGRCLQCGSHGRCDSGPTGTGSCICDATYGGALCSFRCNISTATGKLCGNGTCSAGNVCICAANFTLNTTDRTCSVCVNGQYGPNCQQRCPVCPNTDGSCNRETGHCICKRGYFGLTCQYLPRRDEPCSGHGSCHILTGECQCQYSNLTGYWEGPRCERCVASTTPTAAPFLALWQQVVPAAAALLQWSVHPLRYFNEPMCLPLCVVRLNTV